MTENNPLLKIQFEGQAIGAGKIPVDLLLRFLGEMTKALSRSSRVLSGEAESRCRGQIKPVHGNPGARFHDNPGSEA